MAVLVNLDLLAQSSVCKDYNLEVLDHIGADLALTFQQVHRNIAVQLGKTRDGNFASGFSNISFSEEELTTNKIVR